MPIADPIIRTASNADRSRIANLIHFGQYIHQHLDWKSPLDWIGEKPFLILEEDRAVHAVLACPQELPGIYWIRLFAVGSNYPVEATWKRLWLKALEEINSSQHSVVAALSLQSWFNTILEQNNFEYTDNVVVLFCDNKAAIAPPQVNNIKIRNMLPEDLERVVEVDNAAFDLVWKNSHDSLDIAFQQCSIATVACIDDLIVGYQYSTSGSIGGHLARLAVIPSMQGNGIGFLLLSDLLTQFKHHGIHHITVNTQLNNRISLSLYAKAGFKSTGESYRVYQYPIP